MGSHNKSQRTDMNNIVDRGGNVRWKLLRGACVALALLWSVMPASANGWTHGELIRVDVQSCQLQCGRVLASCERERLQGSHCPRDYQSCKGGCEADKGSLAAVPAPREKSCVQRCEYSASLCAEGANRKNAESCSAGRTQCVERC